MKYTGGINPLLHIVYNFMLFIVSKQCACSRRIHIEGHMNRGRFIWILVILDNNSDNDSFGSVEPLERTEESATRPNSRWSGKDFAW
jgi:hypothetical protein